MYHPSDAPIGTHPVPALAVGESFTDTYSSTYSISQPGKYWFFVTARLTTPADELRTDNNTLGAAVSILYDEVVVDTYLPNPLMSYTLHTVIDLYGPTGTQAPAIASAEGGNPVFDGYARIDWKGGLEPGTYYIRVKGKSAADYGAYAIRILTSIPTPQYSSADYFSVVNNPDSYEPDDAVTNGVPTHPAAITIGDRLNRFLTTGGGDVDWFILTLP